MADIRRVAQLLHKYHESSAKWPTPYLEWTVVDFREEANKHGVAKYGKVKSSFGPIMFYLLRNRTFIVLGKKVPRRQGAIDIADAVNVTPEEVDKLRYVQHSVADDPALNNSINQKPSNLTEEDDWWSKLSPEEQEAYLKEHPRSQKRKQHQKYGFKDIASKDEPEKQQTVKTTTTTKNKRRLSIIKYLLGVKHDED